MDSCEGGETKPVVDGDEQTEVHSVDQGLILNYTATLVR